MANASILAAFERFWQHVVAALGSKANLETVYDITENIANEFDAKLSEMELQAESVCKKTLVWQNTSPNSSFSAQSIAVIADRPDGYSEINEYDGIEIIFTNGDGMLCTTGVLPTTTGQFYLFSPYDTVSMGMCMRKVIHAENSISFGAGYYNKSGTIKEDNVSCIPYRIYLIRGGM